MAKNRFQFMHLVIGQEMETGDRRYLLSGKVQTKMLLKSVAILVSEILDLVSPKDFGMT